MFMRNIGTSKTFANLLPWRNKYEVNTKFSFRDALLVIFKRYVNCEMAYERFNM